MSKFFCGVEEPLQPNEQLYALDERTASIGFAQFTDTNLCRYSFVAEDEVRSDAEFLHIVTKISSALGGFATWLVEFPKSLASSSQRVRVLVKRLDNRRWHRVEGADMYVATRPCSLDTEQVLAPEDADLRIAGWILLLGQPPDDESLVNGPFKESLHMLVVNHRLQPSKEFLAACGRARLAVAYVAKDDRERLGLVVVSPRELSLVISGLQREGMLRSIHYGPDANLAWQS